MTSAAQDIPVEHRVRVEQVPIVRALEIPRARPAWPVGQDTGERRTAHG